MPNDRKKGAPVMSPSDVEELAAAGTSVGLSRPRSLSEQELQQAIAPPEAGRPTLRPGAVAEAAAVVAEAEAVAAAWRTGTVTALWGINEIRNAWMHVANVGWKKIYNGRDWAFTALVTLASQARQTGRQISFREEADGMVYEIYLW